MNLTLDQVVDKMKEDGIYEESFYSEGTPKLQACVHFVYGLARNVFVQMDPDSRIAYVHNLVKTNRKVNRFYAVAMDGNSVYCRLNPERIANFIQMALIAKRFSEPDMREAGMAEGRDLPEGTKLYGGFPGKPLQIIQGSSNCFQAASLVHLSLLFRVYEEDRTGVFDSAHMARRYLLARHEERKKRVIDNKGHNTQSFASQIAGKKVAKKWHILDFADGGIQFLRKFLVYYMEETHFGLISGFHIFLL